MNTQRKILRVLENHHQEKKLNHKISKRIF